MAISVSLVKASTAKTWTSWSLDFIIFRTVLMVALTSASSSLQMDAMSSFSVTFTIPLYHPVPAPVEVRFGLAEDREDLEAAGEALRFLLG